MQQCGGPVHAPDSAAPGPEGQPAGGLPGRRVATAVSPFLSNVHWSQAAALRVLSAAVYCVVFEPKTLHTHLVSFFQLSCVYSLSCILFSVRFNSVTPEEVVPSDGLIKTKQKLKRRE